MRELILNIKWIINKLFISFIVDYLINNEIKNKLLKFFYLPNIDLTINIRANTRWNSGQKIIINKNVFLNYNTLLNAPGGIEIGEGTYCGQNLTIITSTHNISNMEQVFLPVKIGKYCWLGANVTILPGVTIGDFSVVGAGSVVNKDIPRKKVAVGVPARVIKNRDINPNYIVYTKEVIHLEKELIN